MKKRKAFTLVELLIVIAIIGVLATLAIIALSQARVNARDAKRLADVRQMQTALELYFHDNARYPTEEEFVTGSSLISPSTGKVFMEEIPRAPAVADGDCEVSEYVYTVSEDGRSYEILFCTGKVVSGMPASDLVAKPGGIYEYLDISFNCGVDLLTDIDGNEYETVSIGGVCWMAENLKTTKYKDGSDIPNLTDSTTWNADRDGAYSWFNNDEANKETYGALYNWYAATNSKGICPEGWVVPEEQDLMDLELAVCNSLGNTNCDESYSSTNEGSALAGSGLWSSGTLTSNAHFGSTNFNLLPAGINLNGNMLSGYIFLLSSSSLSESSTLFRYLYSSSSVVNRYSSNKTIGGSIRCMDPSNKTYTVKYLAQEGGSISGETEQIFTEIGQNTSPVTAVVDDPMYTFIGWSDGVTDATRTDLDISSSMTITALFQAPFTVNYIASYGGSISGQTTQTIKMGGDTSSVTAIADSEATFVGWSDGLTTATRIDTNVNNDIDVTATFSSANCPANVTFVYNGSSVTYGTVVGYNGSCWLDRNLGASRVAVSYNDSSSYGDLFQWGRAADGHQRRTSSEIYTLSSTDNPGHSSFIPHQTSPYDWRSPQNNNLWQGVSGINNPCPSGFRLPTSTEWNAERLTWSSNNITGAFNSPLKLPAAGYASNWDSSVRYTTSHGYYLSSTVSSTRSSLLSFTSSDATIVVGTRAGGFSLRCIKD